MKINIRCDKGHLLRYLYYNKPLALGRSKAADGALRYCIECDAVYRVEIDVKITKAYERLG